MDKYILALETIKKLLVMNLIDQDDYQYIYGLLMDNKITPEEINNSFGSSLEEISQQKK